MAVPPVRVLFLFQRPEAWVNFASVWRSMRISGAFEASAWVLPYDIRNRELSAIRLSATQRLLSENGIPSIEWKDGLRVEPGRFDLAVFTHPYDLDRPEGLEFHEVACVVAETMYVPYGLSVGGGYGNSMLQYAQPTHFRSTAVIARSLLERAQYAKYSPASDRNVYVTGHPRFDLLLARLKDPVPRDLRLAIGGRTAVLWNSHFSFGQEHSQGSNFSTFDLLGPEIFELALRRRNEMCLIWRPHPRLWTALSAARIVSMDDLPQLRAEITALGIVLDERPDHVPAFCASDCLITDPGSFLLEYLVTEKPLLSLRNVEGEPLNDEATLLVEGLDQASSPDEVANFVDRAIEGSCRRPLPALRDRHLPHLDGLAGCRVVELMGTLAGREIDAFRLRGEAAFDTAKSSSRSPDDRPQAGDGPRTSDSSRIPPTLERMLRELRTLREAKSLESGARKWLRRGGRLLRTRAGEYAKRAGLRVSLGDFRFR